MGIVLFLLKVLLVQLAYQDMMEGQDRKASNVDKFSSF